MRVSKYWNRGNRRKRQQKTSNRRRRQYGAQEQRRLNMTTTGKQLGSVGIALGSKVASRAAAKQIVKEVAQPRYANRRRYPTHKLWISPLVWQKLQFTLSQSETEVSFLGLCEKPTEDDGLLVKDLSLVEQVCSSTLTTMDDEALAKYHYEMRKAGLSFEEFGCVWIHTHPNMPPSPSYQDEKTFREVYGRSKWALMLIAGSDMVLYGRLKHNTAPTVDVEVVVAPYWNGIWKPFDPVAFQAELDEKVSEAVSKTISYGIGESEFDSGCGMGYRYQPHVSSPYVDYLPSDWEKGKLNEIEVMGLSAEKGKLVKMAKSLAASMSRPPITHWERSRWEAVIGELARLGCTLKDPPLLAQVYKEEEENRIEALSESVYNERFNESGTGDVPIVTGDDLIGAIQDVKGKV